MLGFLAVEGEYFSRSLVDYETFLHTLAAILDIFLETVVVGLKLFHSLYSPAFSLYKLLKVVVSLRHRSFFDW